MYYSFFLKAFNLSSKHPFITLHMYVCNLLSQYFWKYTVFKKALNFRNHIIPKFKIRQNPFYKNVIAVPHNKSHSTQHLQCEAVPELGSSSHDSSPP